MRKRDLTKEMIETIVAKCREGVAFSGVCSSVGVSRSVVQSWLAKGRDLADELGSVLTVDSATKRASVSTPASATLEERLLTDLALRYEHARGEVQGEYVACIRLAARGRQGRGDWKAAAFLLERRYQDEWCRLVGEAKKEAIDLILEKLKDWLPEKDFEKLRRQLVGAVVEG